MDTKCPMGRLWRLIKENIYFLAVIIGTFFALVLIVALTFGSFYESARENAITIGSMTVSQESERIEDTLSAGINTLLVSSYTVDSLLDQGATPEDIQKYLVQETNGIISGINPDFSGIYGVVQDEYVDGINWQPEAGYDPYKRPWYLAAAQKHGKLAIVSPYVDAQTNSIMVSFSKLLCDGKSAVSLDIVLDNIYAATDAIQLNGNGYCFLIDRQGQVIAHRDRSQIGKNYLSDTEFADSDIRSLIAGLNTSSEADEYRNVSLDGGDCMVFKSGVYDEWSVVLVVPTADLFKDIRDGLIRNIILSLAIFILVGYFCTSNYQNKKRALRYAEDIRTDDLTGLNNRGEFNRYLSATIDRPSDGEKLYLLLFDADDFKSINDRFGHQEGDRALRLIAKALMQKCHGTNSFCARYGGDEFVIICRCGDEADVKQIVDDLNGILDSLAKEAGLPYSLSLSCGYACFDHGIQSPSELVVAADKQLYRMKAEKKTSSTDSTH